MLPNSELNIDIETAEEIIQPSLTFGIDFEKNCISGFTDGKDALIQSIICRLLTERKMYDGFSDAYGLPVSELIGQSSPLVYVLISNSITETLLSDERITGVSDFVFDTDRQNVTVSFKASSIFGNINIQEAEILV